MTIDEHIKFDAEKIRKKLEGGSLYGRPLDMNDPDAVLIAAYCAGQADKMRQYEQDEKTLKCFEK